MMELRHWIFQAPGCSNVDVNYNTDGNGGRVILSKTSDRGGNLPNSKHEACMCGDRAQQNQLPFYYYVVQGPAGDNSQAQLHQWLDALRTAYNHLFDIWSQRPPCSGECLIMGGASDAWESYAHSTARSIYFQLRAFAAFDPHALPNACGTKGVMLRFGGMTLNDDGTATCYGKDGWGQTGASCPTEGKIDSNFHQLVTQADDATFFSQAGAPSKLVLQTDQEIVTVSIDSGVHVEYKRSMSCPQPILEFPWRCEQRGGVSDPAACSATSPGPSPATTTSPAPRPSPSPTPSCRVGESVVCPGSLRHCAGNQCCPDGSTCPSASEEFSGCAKGKTEDCTGATVNSEKTSVYI